MRACGRGVTENRHSTDVECPPPPPFPPPPPPPPPQDIEHKRSTDVESPPPPRLYASIHYEEYPMSHALTPAQLLVLDDPPPWQFPSLVNCCTIDWFKAWPKDALEAVASKFLKEIDLEDSVRERLMVGRCRLTPA